MHQLSLRCRRIPGLSDRESGPARYPPVQVRAEGPADSGMLWQFGFWIPANERRLGVIPGRDFVYAICAFTLIGAFDPSGSQRRLTRLSQLLQQLKIALDLLLGRVRRLLRF